MHTKNGLMLHVLLYKWDPPKDPSEEKHRFPSTCEREWGMNLSWTFSDSESLQHASRESKKAASELLGAEMGELAPRAEFAVGGNCWMLAEPGFTPSLLEFWSIQVWAEHFILKKEQWWHGGWWWLSLPKPQCVFLAPSPEYMVPWSLSELSLSQFYQDLFASLEYGPQISSVGTPNTILGGLSCFH